MKILVAYYSKTGNTKNIAFEIAKNLKADIDEITDLTNRKGLINWLRSGRDGMKKKLTKVKYSKEASKYDLIIVGTPVWGWNMVPAVRTYLTENFTKIKNVAFFTTSGGTNILATFADMESVSKKPLAKLSVISEEIRSKSYSSKLEKFCKILKSQ